MFKKLANLVTGGAPKPDPASAADLQKAALLRAIADRRKTDPLVGAKIGAREVFQHLLKGLASEKGVHAESLLAALGALAGYACQVSARQQASKAPAGTDSGLMRVQTQDGRTYYFGDALNKPLAESKYSVWSLAAAAAQDAGCNPLPDLHEMFKHVAESLGSPAFGAPRLPAGSSLMQPPEQMLRQLWKPLVAEVAAYCPDPQEWPVLFGLAIQQAIGAAKSAFDPRVSLGIAMESAIAMSKVDLGDA
jgi:hypothetical protein